MSISLWRVGISSLGVLIFVLIFLLSILIFLPMLLVISLLAFCPLLCSSLGCFLCASAFLFFFFSSFSGPSSSGFFSCLLFLSLWLLILRLRLFSLLRLSLCLLLLVLSRLRWGGVRPRWVRRLWSLLLLLDFLLCPEPQRSLFRPFAVSEPVSFTRMSASPPFGSVAGPSGFASTASGSASGPSGFAPAPAPSSAVPPQSGASVIPSAPPLSAFDYPPDDPFAPGFADPEAPGAAVPDPEAPLPLSVSDSVRAVSISRGPLPAGSTASAGSL